MNNLPNWDRLEELYIKLIKEQHARLRKAGYSPEQIGRLTARDVEQILDGLRNER